jgi:hypothetical protein
VLVSARDGERFLGSALGEAGDAEEAEDRARARLLAQLQSPGPAPAAPGLVTTRSASIGTPHGAKSSLDFSSDRVLRTDEFEVATSLTLEPRSNSRIAPR